jgi:hypothetical protein
MKCDWDIRSGQAVTFSHWNVASGEPNGGTAENCAQMLQFGTWNDANCNDFNQDTLCEKILTSGLIFI